MARPPGPMTGKVCVVTGATSGIGRATARELTQRGATVIVVGRNRERATATVDEIKERTGNSSVEFMLADLSCQQDIRRLAQEFETRHRRLDVLINNAGAIMLSRRETVDGIERTFALNHLGYFLLTGIGIDTLKSSAPARIVNVSSSSHQRARIEFDNLQLRERYGGYRAYAWSKLENILFTHELARRLAGTGVTANSLHPGLVATNFLANNGALGRFLNLLMGLRGISAEKGASTPVYLATSPEVETVTGKYFFRERAIASSRASYDEAAALRLWQLSAELTGLSAQS